MHLYIHIPFCKQACHYCDFHFSTSMKDRDVLVKSLCTEIINRRSELPGRKLETIYFGGGTPSLLSDAEMGLLFETIHEHFDVAHDAEITLEANPDDLTDAKIKSLHSHPLNRLSIGIQSFRDSDLKFMNRAHDSKQAERSIKASQDAGFTNITADLIYALPDQSNTDWKENIRRLIAYDVPHISSYCLTVEPKTALAKFVASGKVAAANDTVALDHFRILVDETTRAGFEHYEISNFAKPGYIAVHNSSYWKGKPYLGIGPSAHSFDGTTRRWNVSNNIAYMKAIHSGTAPYAGNEEVLTDKERYNEKVMIGLRAKWGVSILQIQREFGDDVAKYLLESAEKHIRAGHVKNENNTLSLTPEGKFLSDGIASDLFLV